MSMATARRMGFKSARVEAQKTGNKILQRLQEEGTVTWVAVGRGPSLRPNHTKTS